MEQKYVQQTINWLEKVVIGLNFCPFAKREVDKGSVRYVVVEDTLAVCLENLIKEADILDTQAEIETTLLIYPKGFETFGRGRKAGENPWRSYLKKRNSHGYIP